MKTIDKPRQAMAKGDAGTSIPRGNGAPERKEEIRIRAREIYVQRVATGQHGDALSDWLQAERELSADSSEVL